MRDRAATVEPRCPAWLLRDFPHPNPGFTRFPQGPSDWLNISKRRLICETIWTTSMRVDCYMPTTILIVNDNEGVRNSLMRILEEDRGFRVVGEAGDGSEA